PNRPRTIAVNRPYLPDIRAPYRNSCAGDNAPTADRLAAEAPRAVCRSFPRLLSIVRCVLPRRAGFVHPELLRGVLAEPAPNRQLHLSSFNHEYTLIDTNHLPEFSLNYCSFVSIRGHYLSVAITLGEQLSLGLKRIGFVVTRQWHSAD